MSGIPLPLPPDAAAAGILISPVEIPVEGNRTQPPGVVPSEDFRACHALRESHELSLWGNLDRCPTLAESQEFWRGNPYEERHLFLARRGGSPAGLCSVTLPLRENTDTAGIDVLVHPAQRRQGIGRALLQFAEAVAHRQGRTSLDGYHEVPLERVGPDAAMLPAKSGSGALPLADPAVAFAAASGYSLEQVERSSRLDLPVPAAQLARVEAEATGSAAAYSVVHWDDQCPDEFVAGLAALKATMSTDVPTAGLGWEREDWDAARVRDEEAAMLRGGVQCVVAAARHRGTGELVAYTVLNWRPGVPGSATQQDTLVAGPHRGHRLGMLVKAANLRRAQARWPSARSVLTWNASENQHMLSINIALGFRPAGYEGEWQKRLG
ncbi:GCN5-related N-acetyltransferase [Pseudarthrobacter chlorophenolicus A6]|uniref:GCN5-related N-acetyltransferase n=1 Tax=Pseudarthrobacter chlorophenolicus (strain ATCC 700700 / DSM 12829 / CIP 107037 / JCM 12360 / KCTC 9906 / NCIMB 13794 / A6) TaxID=452863 RepID=B8HD23_PSECP|nr:GNAT family N-acetyltransferase [Pseudarthrobacter chlorophenolicus]ACL40669.1 GCN5-related N-acetyltransferase [Pseudarthrobacter chlorophenolicus A6]SDQ77256.1 Acetyltransferase (GNAT) family protein [Pseudarthrobacter chlorophenolicus]